MGQDYCRHTDERLCRSRLPATPASERAPTRRWTAMVSGCRKPTKSALNLRIVYRKSSSPGRFPPAARAREARPPASPRRGVSGQRDHRGRSTHAPLRLYASSNRGRMATRRCGAIYLGASPTQRGNGVRAAPSAKRRANRKPQASASAPSRTTRSRGWRNLVQAARNWWPVTRRGAWW